MAKIRDIFLTLRRPRSCRFIELNLQIGKISTQIFDLLLASVELLLRRITQLSEVAFGRLACLLMLIDLRLVLPSQSGEVSVSRVDLSLKLIAFAFEIGDSL